MNGAGGRRESHQLTAKIQLFGVVEWLLTVVVERELLQLRSEHRDSPLSPRTSSHSIKARIWECSVDSRLEHAGCDATEPCLCSHPPSLGASFLRRGVSLRFPQSRVD